MEAKNTHMSPTGVSQVTGITCETGQVAKRKGRLSMMLLSSALILSQGNNLKTGTRVQRTEGEFSRSVPLHHFYDKGKRGSRAISQSKKQPLAGKEGAGLPLVCVTCGPEEELGSADKMLKKEGPALLGGCS